MADPASAPGPAPSLGCPICHVTLDSLAALNLHIDKAHPTPDQSPLKHTTPTRTKALQRAALPRSPTEPASGPRTPQRRQLKLDLFDNSAGFGLSESSPDPNQPPEALSRAHWQLPKPGKTSVCTHAGCGRPLNVKHGITNCRRCGRLFCSTHTRQRVRLRSAARPGDWPVYDSVTGVFAAVCPACYGGRPAAVEGTAAYSRDRTAEFRRARLAAAETSQMARSAVVRHFLKLADLLAQSAAWHSTHKAGWLLLGGRQRLPFSRDRLLEAQRDLLGASWLPDRAECLLCGSLFGVFNRKHHCRLCGALVDEGPLTADVAAACSVQLPLGMLLKKLADLNYSPAVRQNWALLLELGTCSFRCCRVCKDHLLYARKEPPGAGAGDDAVAAYHDFLATKTAVCQSLDRYRALIAEPESSGHTHVNTLRLKVQQSVKNLEAHVAAFTRRFLAYDDNHRLVPKTPSQVVANIHQAMVMYLQDSLLELKLLNDQFQELENARLQQQKAQPVPTVALTKKQIRELREELMVISEQKFLVESLIEDLTRQRKFDELTTLETNKAELQERIESVTAELGEHGF